MSTVVQAVEKSLIVSVVLITHIPAYLFREANGDSRQRGAEGEWEGLCCSEPGQSGTDSRCKRNVAPITGVLGMAVTDQQVGPFLDIEARGEMGGVGIGDVNGLLPVDGVGGCER